MTIGLLRRSPQQEKIGFAASNFSRMISRDVIDIYKPI